MLNSFYAYFTMLTYRMRREEGQTMAEYGILIGVIALVVIVAAVLLGSSISALFNGTAAKVSRRRPKPLPRMPEERPRFCRPRGRTTLKASRATRAPATTAKPVLALSTMLGRSDGSTGAPAPGL